MGIQASVIEINGRSYDASSGELVLSNDQPKAAVPPVPPATPAVPKPTAAPRLIDGFNSPVGHVGNTTPRRQPTTDAAQLPARVMHSKMQRTKTLNRAAVTLPKPSSALKPTMPAPKQPLFIHRKLNNALDPSRLERANQQQRSSVISKFSKSPQPAAPTVAVAAPSAEVMTAPTPVLSRPVVERSMHHRLPTGVPAAVRTKEVDQGQSEPVLHRRRVAPMLALVGSVLLLGGYVVYLNVPRLALRVAAARAGFSATLPGYSPAGFKLAGPIAYAPGEITIKFSTSSDDREFRLVEKESTWDSQSLLDNYVNKTSPQYLTFQERGLTVYVFNGSQATWVDGGIWYTIEGKSLLNSDQLLKIAGSL